MKTRIISLCLIVALCLSLAACGTGGSPAAEQTPSPGAIESPSGSPTQAGANSDPAPTPSEEPTPTPNEEPSSTPSEEPSSTPSEEPSSTPSEEPSPTPSEEPSSTPSEEPSSTPSEEPSSAPSEEPSPAPSEEPSPAPSKEPAVTASSYAPKKIQIRDKDVSWSYNKTELAIGQSTHLIVELTPSNAYSGIEWTSSDPSVASVSKYGIVTAHKQGSVTITAKTFNGITDTFVISVPNGPAELQYTLTPDGSGYEITGCDVNAYTVHIPAVWNGLPVVSIKGGAFKDCQNLRFFTVDPNQTTFYEDGGVVFTDIGEKTLVVFPPAYDAANYYYVPKDTVAISAYAFAGLNSLRTLTFQEGLQKLGAYAFAEARAQTFIYAPMSLTEIGENLMSQQTNNAHFYGYEGTAVQNYAQKNQIPYGVIREQVADEQTASLATPTALRGNDLAPAAGNAVIVPETQHRHHSWYEDGTFDYYYDLSSYQQNFSGEVRLALESQWSEILPDKNGNTMINAPAQTGLYGAGYNEGSATLRAYDLLGNLIAVQYISNDFSFCFPGAASLSVEGGCNTKLTVLPVEPIYVQSGGVIPLNTDTWYELGNGTMKQYFIIQFTNASVSFDMPNHLNLINHYYGDCTANRDPTKNDHYLIMELSTADASRKDQMGHCSVVLDGMDLLLDNDELKIIANSEYHVTESFVQSAIANWRRTKQTMTGNYFPANRSIWKVTIKADGRYPQADWNGIIYLDEYCLGGDPLTLLHEMVHAVDFSIPSILNVAPGAWAEGRAEYISALVYEDLGFDYWKYAAPYDWSFLSESEKSDFFRYYYFSANRYTEYDVGYYFLCYLNETYGEDISGKIMANIAALTEWDPIQRSEANAALFKQCVEAATEPGVFQNFVRDVIEK